MSHFYQKWKKKKWVINPNHLTYTIKNVLINIARQLLLLLKYSEINDKETMSAVIFILFTVIEQGNWWTENDIQNAWKCKGEYSRWKMIRIFEISTYQRLCRIHSGTKNKISTAMTFHCRFDISWQLKWKFHWANYVEKLFIYFCVLKKIKWFHFMRSNLVENHIKIAFTGVSDEQKYKIVAINEEKNNWNR